MWKRGDGRGDEEKVERKGKGNGGDAVGWERRERGGNVET